VRVTGTEIVGLVPRRTLIDAGRYFLRKQQRSTGISDEEIIQTAIRSMGLSELKPFVTSEKVIEEMIAPHHENKLVGMTCKAFANETASESPAPGGGSISAYMGALAAALGTMVANLSAHKPGWDDRWEEFSTYADQGQVHLKELLALVDEDTDAFNRIMDAFKLPKATPEEKEARTAAIQAATLYATEVPLRTMKAAAAVMPLVRAMAEQGNPNSVSDAGVGALAARSAVLGAYLNVQINAAGLKDRTKADAILSEAKAIAEKAEKDEAEIMATVSRVISGDK
jgi:glutamate formiminotransferase/formiminotetrahydrofolate cyclodeaminase